MPWRVLIVEDEPELRMILRDNLEVEGYSVLAAATGEDGVELAARERPDLVILDLMLPQMSGHQVCQVVRRQGFSAPIIMLTARNTERDRIAGLDYGADDYIGKPFGIGELMARVRAQLRRGMPSGPPAESPSEVRFADVTMDLKRRELRRAAQTLTLTPREFDLLEYFVLHPGDVLSRERLLREVWGYNAGAVTRTVDNFVARLRKHVEVNSLRPRHLLTVHGAGYRFVP